MNIRGNDNPYAPIPNSHLIVTKEKKILLFTDEYKTKKIIKNKIINKNQIAELNEVKSYIYSLSKGTFVIDTNSCSIFFEKIINKNFKISKKMIQFIPLKLSKTTQK